MGNDISSGIIIDLDRNNSFYYTGETIFGTVKLNIPKENLEIREIYISLIGEVGYGITRSTPNDKAIYLLRGEYHQIQFYYKKFCLSRSNMAQQEFNHNRGEYLWPFHIPLIDNLPPSINQPDVFPRVRYHLQVVIIDKLWYISNIKRKKYLTIHPRVNLLQNPRCLTPSKFECENRKDIILKAIFNKLGYISGDNIQFRVEIQNPRKLLIQHINLSMLKYYQIETKRNKCIVYKKTLPKIENLTNEQIIETFSIKLPSIQYPPSYKFHGENDNVFVHIHYMLKLTVKVEGIFTNCHINIPIILGNEPNSDLNQQQTFNPLNISYLSNSQQSILGNDDDDDDEPPAYDDDDDEPPAYDSVMRNLQ